MARKTQVKQNLRKRPPTFNQAQPNPHFPQPQSNTRFNRLRPSPSFSLPMPTPPPFQLMPASTSPEYVTRVISSPSPALYVDPTLVRTVLRFWPRVDRSVSATFL